MIRFPVKFVYSEKTDLYTGSFRDLSGLVANEFYVARQQRSNLDIGRILEMNAVSSLECAIGILSSKKEIVNLVPSEPQRGEVLISLGVNKSLKLTAIRERFIQKMTQLQVAEKLGFSQQHTNRLFSWEHSTKTDTLIKVLEVFGYETNVELKKLNQER